MAWLSAFIFTLICGAIEAQGVGYAEGSFLSDKVTVTVQVGNNIYGNAETSYGNVATIEICGPADVWFGVGFGSSAMANAYAIVVWKSTATSDSTVNANEYKLGASLYNTSAALKRGGAPTETATDFVATGVLGEVDGVLCVTMTRKAQVTGALYSFPNTFSATPEATNIIVATGSQLDWLTATAMASRATGTLSYSEGKLPTPSPTAPPTGSGGDTENASEDSSGICFSSDSYALTWPNFEKKKVSDLQIYDKILTYNELDNTYFWDELLVKIHFEEGEFLNDVMVPMRQFILSNGETLTMTGNHLLYIGEMGLYTADNVKTGDKLKVFNGSYVKVIGIKEDVMKYPRNMITYNGNLVINGVAISTFPDTIWGESEYWGKSLRAVMKYGYSYNIWRYTAYYTAKLWTDYASFDFKQNVLKFYFVTNDKNAIGASNWFSSFFELS